MKLRCVIGCLTLTVAAVALGQNVFPTAEVYFPDVPENHWAYVILKRMKREGLLVHYPHAHQLSGPPATRREIAEAIVETAKHIGQVDEDLRKRVDSLVDSVELTLRTPSTAQLQAELEVFRDLNAARCWVDDFPELAKLARAFRKEVAAAGGDAEAICDRLGSVGNRFDSRQPDSYWARTVGAFAALSKRRDVYPDIPENHWVFEALKQMKHDGLLAGWSRYDGLHRLQAPKRSEIAEMAVATYNRLKAESDKLDAQIKAFAAIDDKPEKERLEAMRKLLKELQKDVMPSRDDIQNLKKLAKEFKADIAAQGVDVNAMLRELGGYTRRTMSLSKPGAE